MQTKRLARAGSLLFALTMLTVYVVSSQRRHNPFVINAVAEGQEIREPTNISHEQMIAYSSKSAPVFVPETPAARTNAAKATNSAKAKKTSGGTKPTKAQKIRPGTNSTAATPSCRTNIAALNTNEIVISSSKSGVAFTPEDVAFFATNKPSTNQHGK